MGSGNGRKTIFLQNSMYELGFHYEQEACSHVNASVCVRNASVRDVAGPAVIINARDCLRMYLL